MWIVASLPLWSMAGICFATALYGAFWRGATGDQALVAVFLLLPAATICAAIAAWMCS